MKHSHYHKDVSHLKSVDVYRVLELFEVTDPALGHAIKKLICAGKRGSKTFETDVREAADTLNRRLQMLAEDDEAKRPQVPVPSPWAQAPTQSSTPVAHVGQPIANLCKVVGCRKFRYVDSAYCTDHQNDGH